MRSHLRALTDLGLIERRRESGFPGKVSFALTPSGQGLLGVSAVLSTWLKASPNGQIKLGTAAASSAIKALVDGWSTGIVRVLASRELPLTELDRLIQGLSYPSLERRLAAMRLAGQLQHRRGAGRGTPYAVTPWLRRAVAPLVVATRWERAFLGELAPPVTRIDVEAAFLLSVPLVPLPSGLAGTCRLSAEVGGQAGRRQAGVLVDAREGATECTTRIQGDAGSWISGTPSAWLGAIIEGSDVDLERGGEVDLADALLDGLHGALFAPTSPR